MEIKDKESHRVVSTAIIHKDEAKNCDLIEGILEEIEMADRMLKGGNSEEISWKQP